MTRVLLLVLSIVEITLGAFVLVGVTLLAFAHPAGLAAVSLPMLAIAALLLVAGAAIFVRRPWSYYAHIAIVILLGALFVLYVAPLVGLETRMATLVAGIIVVALTGLFLLAPVRRYLGFDPIGVIIPMRSSGARRQNAFQ